MEIAIAPLEPSEINLLLSSWKKSYREHVDMRADDFYRLQSAVCDEVLSRYPLLLAARQDGVCLGWICAQATDDGLIVHYCYTKSAYRRQGIAKQLLSAALDQLAPVAGPKLIYTHRTNSDATARRYGFEFQHVATVLRNGSAG